MRKIFAISVCSLLLFSSCGSYTGSGAYVGASFGSILGFAIGGISDGPRGSDVGTIIGMAGGAVIGGAIGQAADRREQAKYEEYKREREQKRYEQSRQTVGSEDSGFDPSGKGDDVLYDFGNSEYAGSYNASEPDSYAAGYNADAVKSLPESLEIRNARFVDANHNKVLDAGETCKLVFEVYNSSDAPLYDVQPMAVETTGNKRIYISPGVHVERIAPGKGIRYTAMVKADQRLKNGMATFKVYAVQGNYQMTSRFKEFNIPTAKK